MATITYSVRGKVKGKLSQVSLRFKDGRQADFLVDSGLVVDPGDWSNKTHTVKQRAQTKTSTTTLIEKMEGLTDHLTEKYNSRDKSSGEVTKVWLNSVIADFHKQKKEYLNLNKYIESFITEIESGKRLFEHNGIKGRYRYGTVKNYKGFKVQFDLFQSEKGEVDYNSINADFYKEFTDWFTEKGYSPNTIGRHIKNIKVILRQARGEKMHTNFEIEHKTFRSTKEEVFNIYLTESEVHKLFNVDLSEMPKEWDIARDVFIVGCETAQRFSDYSRIRKEHIKEKDGKKFVHLIQKKGLTTKKVIIPVSPRLEYILQKYDYDLPKIWEQKLNKKIKLIAEKAKITELVTFEMKRGGMRVEVTKPKCDLIKTHTCRRTGATLMYLNGIPIYQIMKITGHTSERIFKNYIKIGTEETADVLAGHDYFNKPLLRAVK